MTVTCPCCGDPLTEQQIKAIWGAFCASRVPAARKGGGAKPWAHHSDRAGLKCRCVDCIRIREIRHQQLDALKAPQTKPDESALTWEALLTVNPEDGYEKLMRHEASKLVAQRRNRLKRKLASEKFEHSIKLLRERAEKEGVLDKIIAEAQARADARCPK